MNKIAVSLLLISILIPAAPSQSLPDPDLLKTLKTFEVIPTKTLSDQVSHDSFGLIPRGSFTLKKEITASENIKTLVTLSDVTSTLKLYGLFPNQEAIINSILWKINSRLTVRYKKQDYVLLLKEITENSIKIGWLENDSQLQITLSTPSSEVLVEQPEQIEPESSETLLVIETSESQIPLKLNQRK